MSAAPRSEDYLPPPLPGRSGGIAYRKEDMGKGICT